MELSGRVQELQNEANCMNDSKFFQDAESVRSEGCCDILSYRRAADKGRQAFGTRMVYRETFLQIHLRHHQHLILKNCTNGIRPKSRSIRPQWRKVKDQNKIVIRDASLERQPKIQSSSVEETLQRIMGQTNNDCRFRIFISTSSVRQQHLRVGR